MYMYIYIYLPFLNPRWLQLEIFISFLMFQEQSFVRIGRSCEFYNDVKYALAERERRDN